MRQATAQGQSKVDDPARLKAITRIGLYKHAWERAMARRPSQYATGILDLTPGRPSRLLDLVKTAPALCWPTGWPAPDWKARIVTATLDPLRGLLDCAGLPVGTELTGVFGSDCWPRRADNE